MWRGVSLSYALRYPGHTRGRGQQQRGPGAVYWRPKSYQWSATLNMVDLVMVAYCIDAPHSLSTAFKGHRVTLPLQSSVDSSSSTIEFAHWHGVATCFKPTRNVLPSRPRRAWKSKLASTSSTPPLSSTACTCMASSSAREGRWRAFAREAAENKACRSASRVSTDFRSTSSVVTFPTGYSRCASSKSDSPGASSMASEA
mmetsp:Transcript_15828/g.34376  ORF Transcript_15828/g.34376 Transcript_15828/m.34376 type:complete len:200 (-) Transcript_15828:462-1061(-)